MTTAESLIVAFESLPADAPWAAALAAAEAALTTARASAEVALFPVELVPVSADAIADYNWRTARLVPAGYGEQLAELHGRSLTGNPELARLLRERDALDDIGTAASRGAAPAHNLETHVAAAGRVAGIARARYMVAIARQLAESKHDLSAAARALLASDDLGARLVAEKTRREEAAKAELLRAETERREAQRAVTDRTVELVRAAEARAADDRAKAQQSAEEYRQLKAAALVERLRASRLTELRVGHDGALFAVSDVIGAAGGMTIESLARYEIAIARHEDAR